MLMGFQPWSPQHGWQTEVLWKESLAWAAAAEDDQTEDDQAIELHSYFLEDKEIFDGRGNVESHHPGGGRLEEQAGEADRADVCDPGGTRGIGPEEVDPG